MKYFMVPATKVTNLGMPSNAVTLTVYEVKVVESTGTITRSKQTEKIYIDTVQISGKAVAKMLDYFMRSRTTVISAEYPRFAVMSALVLKNPIADTTELTDMAVHIGVIVINETKIEKLGLYGAYLRPTEEDIIPIAEVMKKYNIRKISLPIVSPNKNKEEIISVANAEVFIRPTKLILKEIVKVIEIREDGVYYGVYPYYVLQDPSYIILK